MANQSFVPSTLDEAQALEKSFEGTLKRFSAQLPHGTSVVGESVLLVPATASAVSVALRLARAANRTVGVQSGRSISTADASKAPGALISLEQLQKVSISDNKHISVEAAATTGQVARALREAKLFLPLDDNAAQSIASAVLSTEGSPFLRSASPAESLRHSVVKAEVVYTDGDSAGQLATLEGNQLQSLWTSATPPIVTRFVFDSSTRTTNEDTRWVYTQLIAYDRTSFAELCNGLCAEPSPVSPTVDLTIRALSAAYGLRLVLLRASGHGDTDKQATETVLKEILERASCSIVAEHTYEGAGESIAAWVGAGNSMESEQADVHVTFGSSTPQRSFASFRKALFDAVDYCIGVDDAGNDNAPAVDAWVELQLAQNHQLFARAKLTQTRFAEPAVAMEARLRMSRAIPSDEVTPPTTGASLNRRTSLRNALRLTPVLTNFATTTRFDFSTTYSTSPIPNFKGRVLPPGAPGYEDAVQQYATSSYKPATLNARMRPKYIAKPEDVGSVVAAVQFAVQNNLRVVARSGGHQYCGLSSGGNDTLLLDMQLLDVANAVRWIPSKDKPTQVVLRPGVALRDLSTMMSECGVTVPHGECPLVNVGGHVQTGGVGHQLRSLGVFLDHVQSFKMVTRDPQTGTFREREFFKPTSDPSSQITDDDVFRAVLGGGPGSWGVLTELTVALILDKDYEDAQHNPLTHGYSRAYGYNQSAFGAAMGKLQDWVERAAAGTLPDGIDLFLTVISDDFGLSLSGARFRPALLIVETMCTDPSGISEIGSVITAVESTLSGGSLFATGLVGQLVHGPTPLSKIADAGVRKIGPTGMTKHGREFDLPYKKALYITNTPFSSKFRTDFVKLVDEVQSTKGLKVVFQAVVGGGVFRTNGTKTTHMQRRDGLVQLVFDVFYEADSEEKALNAQRKMRGLLGDFSGGADLRMFWGSFEAPDPNGDELDMSRQFVQNLYYDPGVYPRLQQIKQYTDPGAVFRTSFTVR